tara:strand:- start:1104 stop:1541 length:438 start_codon:yes stop_codon:yes gene_type:complete
VESAESIEIGYATIARVLRQFPSLRAIEDSDVPVEISFTLPVQNGLQHKVWLALQNNDELTFGVNHFQCEWFPCTESSRAEEFVDAVAGWLSGRHRILEHYRGSRCVKAELQARDEDEWKTLATWSLLWIPFPFRKTFEVLTNNR